MSNVTAAVAVAAESIVIVSDDVSTDTIGRVAVPAVIAFGIESQRMIPADSTVMPLAEPELTNRFTSLPIDGNPTSVVSRSIGERTVSFAVRFCSGQSDGHAAPPSSYSVQAPIVISAAPKIASCSAGTRRRPAPAATAIIQRRIAEN